LPSFLAAWHALRIHYEFDRAVRFRQSNQEEIFRWRRV
jgi:hypothetical protein